MKNQNTKLKYLQCKPKTARGHRKEERKHHMLQSCRTKSACCISKMLNVLPAYEWNQLMWWGMPSDRRNPDRKESVVCWKEKSQAASCKSICIECMLVYTEQSFLLAREVFKPLNCNIKLIQRGVAPCSLLHAGLIVFPHIFQCQTEFLLVPAEDEPP